MALLSLLLKQLQPFQDTSETYNPLSLSPLLLILLCTCGLLFKLTRRNNKINIPPSPPKLPIIGNLHHLLGTLPHRSLKALADRYGPLMFVYFGNSPTLVVSSAELASEVMKTHDILFSNRPQTTAAKILLYECQDLGFCNYGEYWRQVRKICVHELLSTKRVQSFQHVREEEVSSLINKIRGSCFSGGSLNFTEMLLVVSDNIVSRCVLGRKIEEENGKSKFGELSRKLEEQFTAMLGAELTQDNLKAILLDMLVGGTDTTATTLEWAMAELVKNPTIMKRAQEEVRSVVKRKSNLDMEDINKMDYLKCVIKETLRLHPPAPLLVPRETAASVKLRDYDIPEKTRVFINAWAIQMNPQLWDKPEEYLPERFINNPVDCKGQDFQFIPFGGGRRGCPGLSFGLASVEHVIANLLYWFDWKLTGGEAEGNLDMTEVNGLNVHKKLPLHLVPTPYSP